MNLKNKKIIIYIIIIVIVKKNRSLCYLPAEFDKPSAHNRKRVQVPLIKLV